MKFGRNDKVSGHLLGRQTLKSRTYVRFVIPKRRDLQFSRPATDSDGSAALPFVIPSPDFLLCGAREGHACGFL
jgi:hypothetical protein